MRAIPSNLPTAITRDGADELVFLDITASSDARAIMADLVLRTARKVFIPLAVGGGIRSVADARAILLFGRRQSLGEHGGGAATGTDHGTE